MKKTTSGFTIVELLIVIVVIAILATISVVAYNGIQQRAQNGQTQQALGAWIKALNLYRVDKGRWPAGYACLGSGYGRGVSGTESTGFQCRQDGAGGAYENATFNTSMKDYIGEGLPTPAFVTASTSDTVWRRGASYLYGGGSGTAVYIIVIFGGVNSCPVIDGYNGDYANWGGKAHCTYNIGLTTDT